MPRCFHCEGKGRVGPVHVNVGQNAHGGCEGYWQESVTCLTCNGSGDVTEGQVEARILGDKVRAWRRDRSMICLTMAEELNVSTSTLSQCEVGRTPWPEDLRAAVELMIG